MSCEYHDAIILKCGLWYSQLMQRTFSITGLRCARAASSALPMRSNFSSFATPSPESSTVPLVVDFLCFYVACITHTHTHTLSLSLSLSLSHTHTHTHTNMFSSCTFRAVACAKKKKTHNLRHARQAQKRWRTNS
jgi:hypothetical protein